MAHISKGMAHISDRMSVIRAEIRSASGAPERHACLARMLTGPAAQDRPRCPDDPGGIRTAAPDPVETGPCSALGRLPSASSAPVQERAAAPDGPDVLGAAAPDAVQR